MNSKVIASAIGTTGLLSLVLTIAYLSPSRSEQKTESSKASVEPEIDQKSNKMVEEEIKQDEIKFEPKAPEIFKNQSKRMNLGLKKSNMSHSAGVRKQAPGSMSYEKPNEIIKTENTEKPSSGPIVPGKPQTMKIDDSSKWLAEEFHGGRYVQWVEEGDRHCNPDYRSCTPKGKDGVLLFGMVVHSNSPVGGKINPGDYIERTPAIYID